MGWICFASGCARLLSTESQLKLNLLRPVVLAAHLQRPEFVVTSDKLLSSADQPSMMHSFKRIILLSTMMQVPQSKSLASLRG
jgi:hypothetical protein